jgi:hypothetical protein
MKHLKPKSLEAKTQDEQYQSLAVWGGGAERLPPLLYMITPRSVRVLSLHATPPPPPPLLLLLLLLLLRDAEMKLSLMVEDVSVTRLNTNANPPPPAPLLLLLILNWLPITVELTAAMPPPPAAAEHATTLTDLSVSCRGKA